MTNPYIGHPSQLWGVEETRLVGGKGDGMHLLQVRNAVGISFTVAADRCADVYRLSFRGTNMGFFSPNGYVAPAYYQESGKGFLKSFTAGFFTTCGFNNVGAPSVDAGEELPLHGTIGNTPAEAIRWEETEDALHIHATVRDEVIFGRKLLLHRRLSCGKFKNWLKITDTVENTGDRDEPVMLMYHMNMGYPLLSESAQLTIPSDRVEQGTRVITGEEWKTVAPPSPQTPEVCYRHYYEPEKEAMASIFNPAIGKGLRIAFDPKDFPCLIQWNQFSYRDYALGLEPRSFSTGGKRNARQRGELTLLAPGQRKTYEVTATFFER